MGTLSGGGNEVISIGERCLLGANAGHRHQPRRRLHGRGRPLRHRGHADHAARRRRRQGPRPQPRQRPAVPPQLQDRHGRGAAALGQLGRAQRGAARERLTISSPSASAAAPRRRADGPRERDLEDHRAPAHGHGDQRLVAGHERRGQQRHRQVVADEVEDRRDVVDLERGRALEAGGRERALGDDPRAPAGRGLGQRLARQVGERRPTPRAASRCSVAQISAIGSDASGVSSTPGGASCSATNARSSAPSATCCGHLDRAAAQVADAQLDARMAVAELAQDAAAR